MNDLDFLAPIEVSHHALLRARDRLGHQDEALIRGEIRDAIIHDRYTETKPPWTYGDGFGADGLGRGARVRYLWNEGASRCWIVSVTRNGNIFVRTLILDRASNTEHAAKRRLRTA